MELNYVSCKPIKHMLRESLSLGAFDGFTWKNLNCMVYVCMERFCKKTKNFLGTLVLDSTENAKIRLKQVVPLQLSAVKDQ